MNVFSHRSSQSCRTKSVENTNIWGVFRVLVFVPPSKSLLKVLKFMAGSKTAKMEASSVWLRVPYPKFLHLIRLFVIRELMMFRMFIPRSSLGAVISLALRSSSEKESLGMFRMTRMAPLLMLCLIGSGCTSVYSTFPDHSSEVVFKTLVAVAKSPEFTDRPLDKQWFVRSNDVTVKESMNQIAIYRELARTRKYEGMPPQSEERTWHIEIAFNPDGDPPIATFTSVGFSIPAHVQIEGDAYFHQVHELLSREDITLQSGMNIDNQNSDVTDAERIPSTPSVITNQEE